MGSRQLVCRAHDLATFMCQLLEILAASTFWSYKGLLMPVQGLLLVESSNLFYSFSHRSTVQHMQICQHKVINMLLMHGNSVITKTQC